MAYEQLGGEYIRYGQWQKEKQTHTPSKVTVNLCVGQLLGFENVPSDHKLFIIMENGQTEIAEASTLEEVLTNFPNALPYGSAASCKACLRENAKLRNSLGY